MKIMLPTIEIKLRKVEVPTPDLAKKRAMPDLADIRDTASGWRDVAVDRAGDLRDVVVERAGELRDFVVEHAADVRETATNGAGDLRDIALDRAADLRGAASDHGGDLRDLASGAASDLRDRASDLKLPDIKLPDIDLSGVDLAKVVAPAAKALTERIAGVTKSLRAAGQSIEDRRKPRRQAPIAETAAALAAGIGSGVALMFFLDPAKGRRRRALLRAKLGRWSRTAAETIRDTQHDLMATRQSVAAKIREMAESARPVAAVDPGEDVLDGPDASADLEAVDAAAGHVDETAATDATTGTPATVEQDRDPVTAHSEA